MDLTAAYGFRMDWIVSFVAVARHGGFSAAAKATFRSQSRISEHIAELEKALGVQLFDRTTTRPDLLLPERRGALRPPRPASHPGAGSGDHRGPRGTPADLA